MVLTIPMEIGGVTTMLMKIGAGLPRKSDGLQVVSSTG